MLTTTSSDLRITQQHRHAPQGDLLRNYLFMLLPTQADQVYREVWQPLEKRLGAENLETLAYLDLLVQGYERANRGDTYRGQTERVRPFENDEDAVISDLIRLSQRAESLTPILDPSKETDPKIRSALQRLQDWGGIFTWPIVLVAIERFRAEPRPEIKSWMWRCIWSPTWCGAC